MAHENPDQHLQRVAAARQGLQSYRAEMGRVRELEQHVPAAQDIGYDINATRGYQQWMQTYQALEADQLTPWANDRLDRMSSILTNIRDEYNALEFANTPEMRQIFVDRRMQELRTTGETYMRTGHDRHFNVIRIANLPDGGYSYTVYDAGHESQNLRQNELGQTRVDAVIERRLLPGASPEAVLHGNIAKMFSTAGSSTYERARDYINGQLDPNPTRVVEDTAQIRNNCSTMGQRILLQDVTGDTHLTGQFYAFMTDQQHTPQSLDALLESKARAIAAGHPEIVRAQTLQENGWAPYKSPEGGQAYRYATPFGDAGHYTPEMEMFERNLANSHVNIIWGEKGGKSYAYVLQSSDPASYDRLGRMMQRTSMDLASEVRANAIFYGAPEEQTRVKVNNFLADGLGQENLLAVERVSGGTRITVAGNFSRSELARIGINTEGLQRVGGGITHQITIPDANLPLTMQQEIARIQIGAQQLEAQRERTQMLRQPAEEKTRLMPGKPFDAPVTMQEQQSQQQQSRVDATDAQRALQRQQQAAQRFNLSTLVPDAHDIGGQDVQLGAEVPPEILAAREQAAGDKLFGRTGAQDARGNPVLPEEAKRIQQGIRAAAIQGGAGEIPAAVAVSEPAVSEEVKRAQSAATDPFGKVEWTAADWQRYAEMQAPARPADIAPSTPAVASPRERNSMLGYRGSPEQIAASRLADVTQRARNEARGLPPTYVDFGGSSSAAPLATPAPAPQTLPTATPGTTQASAAATLQTAQGALSAAPNLSADATVGTVTIQPSGTSVQAAVATAENFSPNAVLAANDTNGVGRTAAAVVAAANTVPKIGQAAPVQPVPTPVPVPDANRPPAPATEGPRAPAESPMRGSVPEAGVGKGVSAAMAVHQIEDITNRINRGETVSTEEYVSAGINSLAAAGEFVESKHLQGKGGFVVQAVAVVPMVVKGVRDGDAGAVGSAIGGAGAGLAAGIAGQTLIPVPGVGFVIGVVAADGGAKLGGLASTALFDNDPAKRANATSELNRIGVEYAGSPGAVFNLPGAVASSAGRAVGALGEVSTWGGNLLDAQADKTQAMVEQNLGQVLPSWAATGVGMAVTAPTRFISNTVLKPAGTLVSAAGAVLDGAGKASEDIGHHINKGVDRFQHTFAQEYRRDRATHGVVHAVAAATVAATVDVAEKAEQYAERRVNQGVAAVRNMAGQAGSWYAAHAPSWLGGNSAPAAAPAHAAPHAGAPAQPASVHSSFTGRAGAQHLNDELKALEGQMGKTNWGQFMGNGDAQVSVAEMRATMQKFGISINELDRNGDGHITGREMTNALQAHHVNARPAKPAGNGR